MKMSWKQGLAGGAAGMALLLAAGGAWAQSRTFNVPAQPISQAITELARQGGVQISAPTAHLSGVRSRPLTGPMDVAAATCRFEGALLRLPSSLRDIDLDRIGT